MNIRVESLSENLQEILLEFIKTIFRLFQI